jgi:DNA polymerase-3 subunit alpha
MDGPEDIHAATHKGQLPTGINVDIYDIPHDCHKTWSLFADGHTKGVFQLEGHLGKTWAIKTQPTNLEELGALVSLIRPGCLRAMSKPMVKFNRYITLDFQTREELLSKGGEVVFTPNGKTRIICDNEKHEIISHKKQRNGPYILEFEEGFVEVDEDDMVLFPAKSMTEHYKDRKQRTEEVEYLHKSLEPILGSTYGVLTYQEQSMKIAVSLAGFGLQAADVLRKAIGKKKADIMAKVKGDFITGCEAEQVVTKAQAEEIFGWIQESQRYSFNKSHAVSYGEGGYWTAYLKAHFPVQFYCSYLHGAQWKQDTSEEVYELVNDAKVMGVDVCVPDFRDQREIPYIRNNKVCFGLGDIKHVGKAALGKIQARAIDTSADKGIADWTWLDYLFVFSDGISSVVNEAIISCGCLDHLQKSRSSMLYEIDIWNRLTTKEKQWILDTHNVTSYPNLLSSLRDCGKTKKEGGGCHNVNRVKIVNDLQRLLVQPPHSLHDTADFIAWCEEKYLGIALTCSKVDGCEKAVEANASCLDIIRGRGGYTVLAVEVTRVKEVKTKRGKTPGQKMAFISMSDSSCSLDDTVVFPKVWREVSGLIHEGNTVLVQGERGRKKGDSFAINKVWQI